jgi:hypothetical protein
MKTLKSTFKLAEDGFNNMPPAKDIDEMLTKLGIAFTIVDDTELKYWRNEEDTLVIQIEDIETNRFGASESMKFAIALTNFVRASQCDEFHTQKNGQKTIMRFWWD